MHQADRHALLADPSRRRLLDALRDAGEPTDLRTLAAAVGLHPNSAREQLRRLEEAGMVRSAPAAPSGRGRPGLRYRLDAEGAVDPYRRLAGLLADELAGRPDADLVTAAAGARWGSAVAAAHEGPPAEPVTTLVELLEGAGFAPETPEMPETGEFTEIRLRACPFLPLERRQLSVVCGVHLGFLRGALQELGAPVDAVGIEPFVRPDLCIATLGTRSDG